MYIYDIECSDFKYLHTFYPFSEYQKLLFKIYFNRINLMSLKIIFYKDSAYLIFLII